MFTQTPQNKLHLVQRINYFQSKCCLGRKGYIGNKKAGTQTGKTLYNFGPTSFC